MGIRTYMHHDSRIITYLGYSASTVACRDIVNQDTYKSA